MAAQYYMLVASLPRGLRRYVPANLHGSQTEQALVGAMASGASVLKDLLGNNCDDRGAAPGRDDETADG